MYIIVVLIVFLLIIIMDRYTVLLLIVQISYFKCQEKDAAMGRVLGAHFDYIQEQILSIL